MNNRQKEAEDKEMQTLPSYSRKSSRKYYGAERASNPHKTLPKA